MARDDDRDDAGQDPYQQEDHQAAYVFEPPAGASPPSALRNEPRPHKRRRVARRQRALSSPDPAGHNATTTATATTTTATATTTTTSAATPAGSFVPLFGGIESPAFTRRREALFRDCWARTEARIGRVLRDAHSRTLDQVERFMVDAAAAADRRQEMNETEGGNDGDDDDDRMPAAFIITGPNAAAQALLFEQLRDRLRDGGGGARFVLLRSTDAGGNLKSVLKRAIKQAATGGGDGGDGQDSDEDEITEVGAAAGVRRRRYLDYDLEALRGCGRVSVAIQDSEGFDGALLSDLIHLFSAEKSCTRFTLLLGVATSVELLQARLLKSAVRRLRGAQFDVVQATTIVERIFRCAVADGSAVPRLGPSLLRGLLDRQRDQMAGVQALVSSLKYGYMCHFYANPLSALALLLPAGEGRPDRPLQREYLQAVRTLPSFRARVERAVQTGRLAEARTLLLEDEYLSGEIQAASGRRRYWVARLLRGLQVLREIRLDGRKGGLGDEENKKDEEDEEDEAGEAGWYSAAYLRALESGIDLAADENPVRARIRAMSADQVISLLRRIAARAETGDVAVGLAPWAAEMPEFITTLRSQATRCEALRERAAAEDGGGGGPLRNRHGSQSRVARTTVVAQRVQLTRDTATLTEHDIAFTDAVERIGDLLEDNIRCEPVTECFLHEAWLHDDDGSPMRHALVPRPRATFERGLRRPHDYLACRCCSGVRGLAAAPSLPATSLLYRLYLETGSLVNVADLWTAFVGVVGEGSEGEGGGPADRAALAAFYQALAELKALGFVKSSRRKVDHVARLKWL